MGGGSGVRGVGNGKSILGWRMGSILIIRLGCYVHRNITFILLKEIGRAHV